MSQTKIKHWELTVCEGCLVSQVEVGGILRGLMNFPRAEGAKSGSAGYSGGVGSPPPEL